MTYPIIPPTKVKVTPSRRNYKRIELRAAPKARRTPISLVRSEAEIYIIFITPTPAINNDFPATQKINKVIVPNNWLIHHPLTQQYRKLFIPQSLSSSLFLLSV